MDQLTWRTDEAARRGLLEIEHRITGGLDFASYLAQLQCNGQAQCTTVWTKTTIAYRCKTCQVNDSSCGALDFAFSALLRPRPWSSMGLQCHGTALMSVMLGVPDNQSTRDQSIRSRGLNNFYMDFEECPGQKPSAQ